jgi:ribonucleotide reductase alpha subunit
MIIPDKKRVVMNIKMDTGRDDLLTDYATGMLKDFYLRPEEDSPQEGYARAAIAWSSYKGVLDEALAQRLYDYVMVHVRIPCTI